MSWETSTRGGRYYTTSRREAGRVIRTYVGAIDRARRIAAADEARRRQKEAERQAWRDLNAIIDELDSLADLFARAALLAAGYHQHARGQWRKRRVRRAALLQNSD